MPFVDNGSSNADLCSWKEAPFPKHLNNNPEAKTKYLREEADKKAALKQVPPPKPVFKPKRDQAGFAKQLMKMTFTSNYSSQPRNQDFSHSGSVVI